MSNKMNPYTNNNAPLYNKNGFELNKDPNKPSQLNLNPNHSYFFSDSLSTPYFSENMLNSNNVIYDKIGAPYDFCSNQAFYNKASSQIKENFYHVDSTEKNKPICEIEQETSKPL